MKKITELAEPGLDLETRVQQLEKQVEMLTHWVIPQVHVHLSDAESSRRVINIGVDSAHEIYNRESKKGNE